MNLFRTISTITFCLLVVFSSSSFMIDIHMCSGNIQDVAFFTTARSCANETKMPPCHKQESKPCCENESFIHEGEDIKSDITKLQLSPVPSINPDHSSVFIAEVIPSSSLAKIKYFNYDPPVRWTDITVEHRVFLI